MPENLLPSRELTHFLISNNRQQQMSSTADMQRVTQCSSQYLVTGVLEHLTSSQATLTMMIITSSSLWPLSWSATSTTLSFTSLSSIAKILPHHTLPLSPCNSRQRRPPRSGRCTPSCSPTLGLGTVRGSGRNWLLRSSSSSRRRRAAAAPRLSDSVVRFCGKYTSSCCVHHAGFDRYLKTMRNLCNS